jgi:hypothetical protein
VDLFLNLSGHLAIFAMPVESEAGSISENNQPNVEHPTPNTERSIQHI